MPGDAKPFGPDNPGNPRGGRPRKTEEVRRAEEIAKAATPEAVERLIEAMRDAPEWKDRLRAIDSLLDRAMGKPTQAITAEIEHKGDAATPELVRHELARLLTQLAPKRVPIEAEAVVVQALPAKVEP